MLAAKHRPHPIDLDREALSSEMLPPIYLVTLLHQRQQNLFVIVNEFAQIQCVCCQGKSGNTAQRTSHFSA
ncbi:hypothetical protein MB02_16580 [Croceicoccus estronivorus]|nr:hypothetical protein MB02_16580 [Croceicoccus estronivorus]